MQKKKQTKQKTEKSKQKQIQTKTFFGFYCNSVHYSHNCLAFIFKPIQISKDLFQSHSI